MVFVETKVFTRRLFQCAGSDAETILGSIQADLLEDPHRGRLVSGLGGIRKARTSNPARGKGKRGGFRYLYLYFQREHQIHLLFLLDKDEQEDLSPAERRLLREMALETKR